MPKSTATPRRGASSISVAAIGNGLSKRLVKCLRMTRLHRVAILIWRSSPLFGGRLRRGHALRTGAATKRLLHGCQNTYLLWLSRKTTNPTGSATSSAIPFIRSPSPPRGAPRPPSRSPLRCTSRASSARCRSWATRSRTQGVTAPTFGPLPRTRAACARVLGRRSGARQRVTLLLAFCTGMMVEDPDHFRQPLGVPCRTT